MPRETKYRLARRRKKNGGGFGWLLLVLLLAAGGGLWWKTSRPAAPPAKAPARPVTLASAPKKNPAPATNVPPPKIIVPPVKIAVTNFPKVVVTNLPPVPPGGIARLPQNLLEAQVALARRGISAGSLDGVAGSQTRAALQIFQQTERLPVTGRLDADTKARLPLAAPPLTIYTVTDDDLARLQPLSKTWLGKSQQTALEFETVLELVAEKSHAHPNLIRRLNPGVDWTNVPAGATLTVPDAAYPEPAGKAAFVVISLAEKTLEAFDENTNLLAHFPCSIAKHAEKRPVGELHVVKVAPHPNYTFDPEVFPEVPEAREIGRKLILPPGPNNPVGTVWISLDRPGYGIHGTPKPEEVGRTESHGCFRLANWNAELLLKLVWVGLPVRVEP